jgi:membrane protein DedA with SNARE-associated domain
VVFWGRLIPGVRTLVSVPAGIELMPQLPFLAWTAGGSLIWILILTLAGQALGEGYQRVGEWLEPITQLIKVLLVLAAIAFTAWIGARLISQIRKR